MHFAVSIIVAFRSFGGYYWTQRQSCVCAQFQTLQNWILLTEWVGVSHSSVPACQFDGKPHFAKFWCTRVNCCMWEKKFYSNSELNKTNNNALSWSKFQMNLQLSRNSWTLLEYLWLETKVEICFLFPSLQRNITKSKGSFLFRVIPCQNIALH